MGKFILAIDQGTTGTTCSLMDEKGYMLAKVNEEFRQIYPRPGWVEHDPEDIWKSVVSTIHGVLEVSSVKRDQIAAIGITNQRETALIWDRVNSQPIYNAIVWQCRRTSKICEQWKAKGFEKIVKNKTGLVIDPYFSATKVAWLSRNVENFSRRVKAGELAFGTVDSFLLWRLTAGEVHATDVTNASRTMLMNLKTGRWDDELLKLFRISPSLLPEIHPSSGIFGHTKNVPGLPDGIPIAGIAGDQQAALFGQACFQVGDAKCTYGTGSFVLMNTGAKGVRSKSGCLTTVAWQLEGRPIQFALEGGAFICGAAVQWLRDGLNIIESSQEVEALARQVEDSGEVEFVPALAGLGAPYWADEARGVLCGLTRGTNRAHIARATLEGMALQNVDILRAMEKDLSKKTRRLRVDGGAAANDLLMQMQADYSGVPLTRPKVIETTAAGASYLAGLGVGIWTSKKDIERIWQVEKKFSSQLSPAARKKRLQKWHAAIERTVYPAKVRGL